MKITSLNNASYTIKCVKTHGDVVVHCHGVFDVLHLGHIKYLEKAKSFGTFLVVTITPDRFASKAPGRPFFTEQQRAETIEALSCVDMVAINDYSTAVEAIITLNPDVFVKGGEYSDLSDGRVIEEKKAIESIGGRLEFTNEITFSSSKLINYSTYTEDVISFLESFSSKYELNTILNHIERLKSANVLVIGEAVIDEYIHGEVVGKSNKSPSLVFKTSDIITSLGVPFNVTNHISSFCNSVTLLTTRVGFEYPSINKNINVLQYSGDTIKKIRYVDTYSHSKVFEVYTHTSHSSINLADNISDIAGDYDIVIVCDSGHGMLTYVIREKIKAAAKFLAVNTQTNAGNVGSHSIRKYWDRTENTYVCVNEREFKLATHEHWDDDTDLNLLLKTKKFFGKVAITRGPIGCKIADWEGNIVDIPAFAQTIVDPVGAGDAFLSITALLAHNEVPIDVIGFIGNAMGALATTYEDNKEYIPKNKLISYIKTLMR